MASNTVPCPHPQVCGVNSHVAGSRSARMCQAMKGMKAGSGAKGSGRKPGWRPPDLPSADSRGFDRGRQDREMLMDSFSGNWEHEYDLKEETVFRGDSIAVDSDGCGCTDCLTGDSINSGAVNGGELAMQHFDPEVERGIINRTGGTLYVVARPSRGESWRPEGDPRKKYGFLLMTSPPKGSGNIVEEIPPRGR